MDTNELRGHVPELDPLQGLELTDEDLDRVFGGFGALNTNACEPVAESAAG